MKKIVCTLLALLFLASAYVNLNDPDPLLWVLVYGATALLFGMAALGRTDRRISGWYALALGVWMLTMLPGMVDWFRLGTPSITAEMQATEPHIEVVREFLGLLIAVVALAWLSFTTPPGARLNG